MKSNKRKWKKDVVFDGVMNELDIDGSMVGPSIPFRMTVADEYVHGAALDEL